MLPLIIAFAIVALIVLIARVRLHAFLALMLVSALTGLAAGLPPAVIAGAFQEGVGSTLGFTAVVISLGAIFGKLLADSGGASVVARAITGAFGAGALPWAVAAAGFLVGLPVFFSVGLVLLVPVVWEISSVSGRPFLVARAAAGGGTLGLARPGRAAPWSDRRDRTPWRGSRESRSSTASSRASLRWSSRGRFSLASSHCATRPS